MLLSHVQSWKKQMAKSASNDNWAPDLFFHRGPQSNLKFIFGKFTIPSNSMMITKSIHLSYDGGREIQKEIEHQTI
jgi:hypothetical protein